MTLKDATANSLLMFVAATCVVLIVKAVSPVYHAPPAAAGAGSLGAAAGTPKDGVQVYYIHGNLRCVTCVAIENYSREAVKTGFPEELRTGRFEWRAINYEDPGNEHYAIEYEIVAPSVILAKFEGGRQVEWKGLHEIWRHVGDKDAFVNYVQNRLREFAGAALVEAPTRAQVPTPVQPPTPAVPVFGAPIPEATDAELPVPEEPASDLPASEISPADMPLSDTPDSQSPPPASPLRSPAESPQFFLPTPER